MHHVHEQPRNTAHPIGASFKDADFKFGRSFEGQTFRRARRAFCWVFGVT